MIDRYQNYSREANIPADEDTDIWPLDTIGAIVVTPLIIDLIYQEEFVCKQISARERDLYQA